MNAPASSNIEDFEADLVRQLGLTMSIEQLRHIGCSRRSTDSAAASSVTSLPAPANDFESRYKACRTAAQRIAFVRANKAEARAFFRSISSEPAAAESCRPRRSAESKHTRRRYK